MKKLLRLGLGLTGAVVAWAQPPPHPGWLLVEEEVAAAVQGPQVTVVHFWAPWCPNSLAELGPGGWAALLAANRDVTFIFVTVRSADDGGALLAAHGVGPQGNLVRRQHPNPVRKGPGSLQSFMDLPVTWVPTTWVFREGQLRYALNYGEARFPLLQQLIQDAAAAWAH